MDLEALQVNCQSKELMGQEWNISKEYVDTIQAALQVHHKKKGIAVPVLWLLESGPVPNSQEFDQSSALWRLGSLPQCCGEGNFTVLYFGRTNYC